MRALWHRENLRTRCQEKRLDLQSLHNNWKDTSHDLGGIAYVYRLEGHELWLGQDSLCLPIGKTWVMTWARSPMSINWKDTSYNLGGIAYVYQLRKISRCTRAAGDNFRHCNSMPRSPRVSNQDSVFASKFWPFLCCCLGVKQTTIQSSSLSTSFGRFYVTSRCRYRLMHPAFPTQSSATKTQSLPPSFGSSSITFEFDCGYYPRAAYQEDRDLRSKSRWWASRRSYKCHEYRKNLPHGLSKSFSAGPLELRAWIWA